MPGALLDIDEHRLQSGPQHGVDRRRECVRRHQDLSAGGVPSPGERPQPEHQAKGRVGHRHAPSLRDVILQTRNEQVWHGPRFEYQRISSAAAKYLATASTGGSWGA